MKMKLKIKIKYKAFIYLYNPGLSTVKNPVRVISPVRPRNPFLIPAKPALQF